MCIRDSHNAAQSYVEAGIYECLSEIHPDSYHAETIRDQLTTSSQMKELLGKIWPLLTPADCYMIYFLRMLYWLPPLVSDYQNLNKTVLGVHAKS